MDNSNKKLDPRFQHLGPIVHPDDSGIYMDVLRSCVGNSEIKNLAIAGPYAAGKSSIINRYCSITPEEGGTAPDKVLHISLADYVDTKKKEGIDLQAEDLEMRILQQILYTVSGDALPQSRFNRIQHVTRSLSVPAVSTIWLMLTFFLGVQPGILSAFSPWTWQFFSILGLVVLWTTLTILGGEWLFYFFKSRTFNKVSLKNLEFERAKEDSNSFLSKYFDEILYFFSLHPYEVVIFEDLDRFGTSAIFAKLHELNTLLNNNKAIGRPIQFVYALKDSMFVTHDRTKFFDFILPIVPVTGTANSEDTFIGRNNAFDVHIQLNERFLKDVAQFVIDPRVIHNTFNEYVVYHSAVKNPNLYTENMFALLLYKNIFVQDFELLLGGKGLLFGVINKVGDFKQARRRELNTEIQNLQVRIAESEHESVNSERALVNLYIGELSRQQITQIDYNGWHEIFKIETINELKRAVPYEKRRVQQIAGGRNRTSELSLQSLEEQLHPGKTIDHRLQAILDKKETQLKHLRTRLQECTHELREVERVRLQALCSQTDTVKDYIQEVYLDEKTDRHYAWQHVALVNYLLRHGYINEDYALYMTVFNNRPHWTQRDQKFYLNVQGQFQQPLDVPIDNPEELAMRLSDIDFKSPGTFNLALVNYLVTQSPASIKTRHLLKTVKSHYWDEGGVLIEQYIRQEKGLTELAVALLDTWPEYLSLVFEENPCGSEAQWLIGSLPADRLAKSPDKVRLFDALTAQPELFIQANNDAAAANALNIIEAFSLDVKDLTLLADTPKWTSKLISRARFELTQSNIHFVLYNFTDRNPDWLLTQTYAVVMSTEFEVLKTRIHAQLDEYVSQVMLPNPDNTDEPGQAILDMINNTSLSDDNRKAVIGQQAYIFPDLQEVKHV